MTMPLIGLGTWKVGGNFERNLSHKDAEIQSIRYALSLGYRLIDTAETYGAGGAEKIVGEAIQGLAREDLFLVSKVWNTHLTRDALPRALESSLQRLKTTYLDLYLIHRPNPDVPIGETLGAMAALVQAKMIRRMGVSNFDVPTLTHALATGIPIDVNQIEYSIVNRSAETAIIPFCISHNIHIMAYRPLGRGTVHGAPAALFSIAKRRGATPAQIALSFIISQGISAIPKASHPGHIKENWDSQNYPLSKKELEELRG